MRELAITAANTITAVGHDGAMTAASVRAGISRFTEYEKYEDEHDNPITVARISGIHDSWETPQRMSGVAELCLEKLLTGYFREPRFRPPQITLLLGVPAPERPGPNYGESCLYPLREIVGEWTDNADWQVIPRGNASLMYALHEARRLIESNPPALCIIGGVDSLIRPSTLNWFEQRSRLKSASYGRHQALIAGEAAGFLLVQDQAHAEQADIPILARITGLGVAEEPLPRASGSISRSSGLTEACHAALAEMSNKHIGCVFNDLNGENTRAKEWGMTEIRCLEHPDENLQIWTPANCYGDIGAASGAVIAGIVTQGFVRGWVKPAALITCSDDHGACGAVVLDV